MAFADWITICQQEFTSLVRKGLSVINDLCLEYEYEYNFVYHDCVEVSLKKLPLTITIDDADNHMIWVEDPLELHNCYQDTDTLHALLKRAIPS